MKKFFGRLFWLIKVVIVISVIFSLGVYVENKSGGFKKYKGEVAEQYTLLASTYKTQVHEPIRIGWEKYKVERAEEKQAKAEAKKIKEEETKRQLTIAKEKQREKDALDISKILTVSAWAEFSNFYLLEKSKLVLKDHLLNKELTGNLEDWIEAYSDSIKIFYGDDVLEKYIIDRVAELCLNINDWDEVYDNTPRNSNLESIANSKIKEIKNAKEKHEEKMVKIAEFMRINLEPIKLKEELGKADLSKINSEFLDSKKESMREVNFKDNVFFVGLILGDQSRYSVVICFDDLIMYSAWSPYNSDRVKPYSLYLKQTQVYVKKDHITDYSKYYELYQSLMIAYYDHMLTTSVFE